MSVPFDVPPELNSSNPRMTEASKAAMTRLLSAPPENLISMLDRLGIPWEKIKDGKGRDTMVIDWQDLMKGEQENQKQGPFVRVLFEEIRKELGVNPNVPMQ